MASKLQNSSTTAKLVADQDSPGSSSVSRADCSIEDFRAITAIDTTPESVPLAHYIDKRIPVYCGATINAQISDEKYIDALLSEWNSVFDGGAGVIVVKDAFTDTTLVDDASAVLTEIIASEATQAESGGDHFAAAGANSRIWNAQEKLATAAPEVFANYYANPVIHLASRAWLGPGYQITAQVNVVHPGGSAQVCHRDYHLGFQSIDRLVEYPRNVHHLSPHLTLQGAIAHSPMPVASGPTQFLPFSQRYLAGYVATQLDEFRQHFADHYVQLPLNTGDMAFFNPAVFHAAGDNATDDDRFANLLQIGSAFGRTLELVNRDKLCRLLYPVLLQWQSAEKYSRQQIDFVIAATAEGYSFPCSLDLSPPVGGMAPPSQYDLMRSSLRNSDSAIEFNAKMNEWKLLQRSVL